MSLTVVPDTDSQAPDWANLVTAISAIIISVLGFFGNLLTLLALPHARRLRHAATWLVVNLAVAEGAFCVTILPISAAHLLHIYTTGRALFDDAGCSVFVFLRYVNIQAELLSIAAIAINRCVLIARPKVYPRLFTGAKTAGLIAGIWLVSVSVMLLPLLEVYGQFTYNHNTDECDFDDETELGQTPRKVFLSLGFLLPCILIIASYSYIYYKARQSSAKVRRLSGPHGREAAKDKSPRPAEGLRSRDIRIARTIGVIFLVFLVCCTPVSLAHYFDSKMHMPTLLLLLHPLYWAQYCINIFVYVFMNRQYRDAYVNFISQWWPDFKEVSRRRFRWKEEPTSGDSRRQSRAATPNTAVRFNVRMGSSGKNYSDVAPSTPNLADTRL